MQDSMNPMLGLKRNITKKFERSYNFDRDHPSLYYYWGGLGLAFTDLRAPSLTPPGESWPKLLAGRPG